MDKPKVAATSPIETALEAGKKYAWCSCGLSATQPFCDGSHRGTSFTPHVFEADESKTAYFCACKNTANKPFCDGSHSSVTES